VRKNRDSPVLSEGYHSGDRSDSDQSDDPEMPPLVDRIEWGRIGRMRVSEAPMRENPNPGRVNPLAFHPAQRWTKNFDSELRRLRKEEASMRRAESKDFFAKNPCPSNWTFP
jgi:hypothetical protein